MSSLTDELAHLTKGIGEYLDSFGSHLVRSHDGEPRPEAIEFYYNPPDDVSVVKGDRPGEVHASTGSANEAATSAKENLTVHSKRVPKFGAPLRANLLCELCSDRVYAVKQFKKGAGNILVLYFNGSYQEKKMRLDRSDKFHFGSQEEDELFTRMIEAGGYQMSDFSFQEFVACHFDATHSSDEDWQRRSANCKIHLETTVRENPCKGLILVGSSAILLLGKEKATELATKGETTRSQIGGKDLPIMVIRSLNAFISIEGKRRAAKNADETQKWKNQEIEIKKIQVNALKKFKEQCI